MDWDDYPLWEDRTAYSRVIVVDGGHPLADDGNPGSADAPLRSINAAAQRAQPAHPQLPLSGTPDMEVDAAHQQLPQPQVPLQQRCRVASADGIRDTEGDDG